MFKHAVFDSDVHCTFAELTVYSNGVVCLMRTGSSGAPLVTNLKVNHCGISFMCFVFCQNMALAAEMSTFCTSLSVYTDIWAVFLGNISIFLFILDWIHVHYMVLFVHLDCTDELAVDMWRNHVDVIWCSFDTK